MKRFLSQAHMHLPANLSRFSLFVLLGPLLVSLGQDTKPNAFQEQIILTVSVMDRQHQPVVFPDAVKFNVFEEGLPQSIISIGQTDTPICMGFVVDTSGSMRPKHDVVIAELMNLVKARGGRDSVFVVNFNDYPYLDQDLTNDLEKIESGLRRGTARGGTALYDAVAASADRLAKARACTRRILLVVTDGRDNESRHSLQQTVDSLRGPDTPTIYAFALPEDQRSRQALEALTAPTGGMVFFLRGVNELNKASQRLLQELERQYIIIYARSTPGAASYRRITVEIAEHDPKEVIVRTRAGISELNNNRQ